ncbi:MAG: hypothetical protein HKN76_13430 [Saprospiraceae bacterium]|nr:hypothetical protein [Saprospiraceae bacterium]
MRYCLITYGHYLLLSLILSPVLALAQKTDLSNLRNVHIHNQQDSFYLSSFTIIPESFQVSGVQPGVTIGVDDYQVTGPFFVWSSNADVRGRSDSLSFLVTFRVMPYNLEKWTSRFDSLLYQDGSMVVMEPLTFSPFATETPLFAQSGIQYDGSFARGLSVGNRQDLVLTSNFDLRMSGSLGDGIDVLAALSDNSIPLQPEGNTQQLQEFDKIFIQLNKGSNTLIGGDFELSRPNSYFTNYFKKNQGVRLVNESVLRPGQTLTTAASTGGSRGKFARLQLATQEGNQGPYRLPGTQGERFIIILAGTEKIYHDGILLVRGLEKDYIIDYNSGEITFTANRLITKDSRIIAEYEYSDQNYNRSLYTFETDYRSNRFGLHFNLYSEQDGKLTSGLNELSTEDKRFLADLGDSTSNVLSPTIRLREEGYDPSIVMYKLIDSLGYSEILVRSTNPDSARYTARFSLVGTGGGDYIRVASESNGEVYAWVAPDSLLGSQGSYAPVAPLVAPQQRQMFALGSSYKLGHNGLLETEIALSRLDLNRFSSRDDGDDYGTAIKSRLVKSIPLQRDSVSGEGWQLKTELQHEMVSRSFQPLNPYRPTEFTRDWNLTGLASGREHLANGLLLLEKPGVFQLGYEYAGFFRNQVYQGNKNVVSLRYNRKGLAISSRYDQLLSHYGDDQARFNRPKFDISQALDKNQTWTAGIYFEQEKNEQRNVSGDTLTPSSFYYDLGRFYLRKANSERLTMEFQYQKRYDYFNSGRDFEVATEADDFSFRSRWVQQTNSILDATFTIRNLDIKRNDFTGAEGGLNYVGKINHQLNLWQGALRSTTAYEVGSGQEPKRTFQYLRVDPGQGVYTFLDLNDDGIEQINEFEIAPFPEQAEYVRVTVLTNDFIATNNVTFNQSYSLDPRRIMNNKKAFFAKWSDQGSMRIVRKNLENAGVSIWSPFTLNIADSSLVSVSAQIRNVLYFNRSNAKYDIQYEWNDFRNRFVLTTGYESKILRRHILRSRINFSRTISALLSIGNEQNNQDSETFDTKDYQINSWDARPEINWQPSPKFRLSAKYRWAEKENLLSDNGDRALIHDFKLENTFSKVSTSSFRGNLSLVLIDFQGPKNGALEFAMLEGLKDGENWIWGLAYDRRLANNIRINVSYDGRKSGSARIVHTARAQVSAFF